MHGILNGHFMSKSCERRPLKSLCWRCFSWGKSDLYVFLIPPSQSVPFSTCPRHCTAIRISGFSLCRYNSGSRSPVWWRFSPHVPAREGSKERVTTAPQALPGPAEVGQQPQEAEGPGSSSLPLAGSWGHFLGHAPVPPLDLPGCVGSAGGPPVHR